jgi:hypothetical protein
MKLLRAVASEIGRGLLSGLAGTAAMTVSSTLQVAPPVWRWSREEVAIDVLHHAVYVAAADAAYRATG